MAHARTRGVGDRIRDRGRGRNNRRLAESELRAAIALEPGNPSYRVILAELYQQNGLRRRAQSELERALAVDPTNQTIGALLTKLKSERSVLK